MKALLICLLLSLPICGYSQGLGPGRSSSLASITSPISFSPAGGSYSSPQTVTITSSISGDTIFYTTDGSTPTIAATQYTGPITVSSDETITAISATVATINQNEQASSTNWKINTVNGSPCPAGGCPTANAVGTTGGVGSNPAYSWSASYGNPAEFTLSTQALSSSGETQDLNIFSGAAANNATMMAQDKLIMAVGDSTIQANMEVDMYLADAVHTINGPCGSGGATIACATLNMWGLQANQQTGTMQWQIDNQQGTWQNTGISDGIPISTTSYTEIRYTGHRIIGDTGCGGYGCTYYDTLQINTGCTVNGVCSTIGTVHNLNVTLESYIENWSSVCGNQDQTDLYGPSSAGTQTGGRYLAKDNTTCGNSINAVASATYSGTL